MILDSLQSVVMFVRVAEKRSFTEAASLLGLSPSGVSKAIARMEDRLGVRLLHRTTRNVNLTHDGTTLYESCRAILDALEDAENAVSNRRSTLRGKLRIQMPIGLGQRIIVPCITRFAAANPELTIDAELSDRSSDLANEGLDLAIRIGELRDTRYIARHLCNLRFITVASPRYLKQHGEPRTPEELDSHRCLVFYMPHLHRYRDWRFSHKGKTFSRTPAGVININDAQAVLDTVIAGAGVANIATYVAHDAVKKGLLRVILKDYTSSGPPVSIVYLERKHMAPRVHAFIDYLKERIPRIPHWDKPFV